MPHTIISAIAKQHKILKLCLLTYLLSRLLIAFEYSAINNLINNQHDLISNLWRWDSPIYQHLARYGYSNTDLTKFAFFPLWPILLKICSLNGLFDIPIVGILLNQILLFLSLVMLYLYLQQLQFDEHNCLFGIVLLAFSPANIYFCAGLTEPLFLFLTISGFYALATNKTMVYLTCAALLSATKMVGVFFFLPIIYQLYRNKDCKIVKVICYGIICSSGLMLYMLYNKINTGEFFTFLTIESTVPDWVRPGLNWNEDLVAQLYHIATATSHIYDRSIFFISLFLISSMLLRHKLIKEGIFNIICVLPGLISGNMWNAFRFDTGLFTFYLGLLLLTLSSSLNKYFIISLSVSMSFICWLYWLSGSYYFA